MELNRNDFASAFNLFLDTLKKNSDQHMNTKFPTLPKSTFDIEVGSKYIRVIKSVDAYNRHVFCFVNKTTGDVLKAASWKAPAKHVRGNIFNDPSQYGVNEYGANYLR